MTQFTSINTLAIITATSNKQSEKIVSKKPTKTFYLQSKDKKEADKLKDFGLIEYQSQEKGSKPFFIVKSSNELDIYIEDIKIKKNMGIKVTDPTTLEEVDNPNFYTDEPILINIIKVKSDDPTVSDFYRVKAFKLDNIEKIKETEPHNPFED